MLYDGLFTLNLPARPGPPVRVGWREGIENLLFEGRFHPSRAECVEPAAVVLGRCWQVLRALGATETSIRGDADETLDLQVASERWGESPPPLG